MKQEHGVCWRRAVSCAALPVAPGFLTILPLVDPGSLTILPPVALGSLTILPPWILNFQTSVKPEEP